jgi:type II secretory pathway pseudopilin PulG
LSPMRARHDIACGSPGYCLAELLVTLALMGMCLAIAAVSVCHSLDRQQERGAAQAAQAAAAWAQAHVVWQGGEASVALVGGHLTVGYGSDSDPDDLGLLAPSATVTANVGRWLVAGGVVCHFLAPFGSPDSGGSLRIESDDSCYKITIRPESGLTVRTWSAR